MTEQMFGGDDLATSVWKGKYALPGETHYDQMHHRMAREFARVDASYIELDKEKLSVYGRTREPLTEERIYELFKDFKYIVPQGSVMSQLGADSIGSLSNCFVIGQPVDSYGGIMQKDEEMAQLMKRRGGVGIDISTLRPESAPTSNVAKSSTGAVSFMHRFSNTTREVAQNGRRGALMVSIDVNHPDVLEFAKIKRDLTKVTGANISIRLNDDFMKAVEADEDYVLRFPIDLEIGNPDARAIDYNILTDFEGRGYIKRIKAKELWDEIIQSAHNVAEPGLFFLNNHWDYSPDGVYPEYKGVTTNPCGEIFMQPYDACRLIAVNLSSFVEGKFTNKAGVDFGKLYEVCYEAMRLSDDLVDLELEHIDRIVIKIESDPEPEEVKFRELSLWKKIRYTAESSRRTGMGFTALGDMLAFCGLKYDSEEAKKLLTEVMKTKMQAELDCTIDMAKTRGAFSGWDVKKEFDFNGRGQNRFFEMLVEEFPLQTRDMMIYGRRNISFSTVAPTGSLSILTQTTSGIEPMFMPFYMRRKKVNPNDVDTRVDFTDDSGDTWQEFPVLHPAFKEWIWVHTGEPYRKIDLYSQEELQDKFEQSPWYGSTANDIDWTQRVEIQGIVQQYTTHSISSTVNLPEDVKESEVADIYLQAWNKGLKGITVYREGSRSGVLVNNSKPKGAVFEYRDAVKRPQSIQGEAHNVTALGKKFNVIVGLIDGKPYEVFAYPGTGVKGLGEIVKEKKGEYHFIGESKERVLTEGANDEQTALTRMISTSLRHGADIKYIVEQLNKADGTIVSFTKAIARTLKRYIPEGSKSTVKCNDCGSDNVIFEEGCNKCRDCGSSKCG